MSLGGEAQAKGSGGGFNFDAPIAQCQPYDYSAAKAETGMYIILGLSKLIVTNYLMNK